MNNIKTALTEKHTQLIVWILLALYPIVGMVVDLVAPSLPAIAQTLQISHKLQKVLSRFIYLVTH